MAFTDNDPVVFLEYATNVVHDPNGQITHCPGCGAPVVERDWYAITGYRLTERGECPLRYGCAGGVSGAGR